MTDHAPLSQAELIAGLSIGLGRPMMEWMPEIARKQIFRDIWMVKYHAALSVAKQERDIHD